MRCRIMLGILLMVLLLIRSVAAQEATETPDATEMPEATDKVEETPEVEQTVTDAVVTIPPEIAAHDEAWPLANKDYENTRATFDSNINSSTVSQMEVAWTFPIPGRPSFNQLWRTGFHCRVAFEYSGKSRSLDS